MSARLDEANEWLYLAGEDLRAAELLSKEGIFSLACFHAQQCAEKTLKAIIVFKEGHSKRIHDLNELLETCISLVGNELRSFEEALNFLNAFYAPARYPDAMPGALEGRLPNKEDAAEAICTAEQLYAAVSKIVDQ